MRLTIDIGNSVIGVALFENDKIIKTFGLETRKGEHFDHYLLTLSNLIQHYKKEIIVENAIIGSVVPHLTSIMEMVVETLFKVVPILIEPGVKTGIILKVDHPAEVGADIVACAVGAFTFGEGPFTIIDLGTANKYFFVDEKKVFHGVAISSGLRTSFNALINNADQLLNVPFFIPKNVLGKNTKDSLASGAMYSLLNEIEGFVKLIKAEVGRESKVILTGGNANYIAKHLNGVYQFEPNLIHYGLLTIMGKNYEE